MILKRFGIPVCMGLLILSGILIAGCMGDEAEPRKEISIGYVTWDCAIASTHVIEEVFTQAGYDVEIIAVDAGPLYAALASGDVDFTTNAWLPHIHQHFWEEYGDRIDYVNANIEGSGRHGIVVPAYVTIDSIEEMNTVADKFDHRIIGVEPGAGVMTMTENAIEGYDLEYELIASSSAGMAAELRSAINSDEWIAVTGWSPHWKFGRFDLKFLDDPRKEYGEFDDIVTLARMGLREDDPEAYGILERFQWTADDIASVMTDIESGTPAEEAAQAWVNANQATVHGWIGDN